MDAVKPSTQKLNTFKNIGETRWENLRCAYSNTVINVLVNNDGQEFPCSTPLCIINKTKTKTKPNLKAQTNTKNQKNDQFTEIFLIRMKVYSEL